MALCRKGTAGQLKPLRKEVRPRLCSSWEEVYRKLQKLSPFVKMAENILHLKNIERVMCGFLIVYDLVAHIAAKEMQS